MSPDEFFAQPVAIQNALLQLERWRAADAALNDERPHWLANRRLAILAPCCVDRGPLVEVMDTEPPSVLVGQVSISEKAIEKFTSRQERAPWQGAGQARDSEGFVWLSTFEQMAERPGPTYKLWCRHRRWKLHPEVVVTLRGEHADALQPDNVGHMR